jgi:hypothetical protein
MVGVAAVAAVASYEHAYALVRAHGEAGWTGRLVPLTVDGLIYASSMVMLDSPAPQDTGSGAGEMAPRLGIAATLALVGSFELLMMVIRGSQAIQDGTSDSADIQDPPEEQAAEIFADQLAADRVPSIRAIRAQLHVGQPRAQRLRDYPAAGAAVQAESPAA